jgi:hypothetical protein
VTPAPRTAARTVQVTCGGSRPFCAGLTISANGEVIETAPILRHLRGLPERVARETVASRGWTWEEVPPR